MSELPDVAAVAAELGAMIDERWPTNDGKPLFLVDHLQGIESFVAKSGVHARCVSREKFLLPAHLWHPQRYRRAGTWPYTHFLIGTPKPELGDSDPLAFINSTEGNVHYQIRAAQCPDIVLRARYWDFAALAVRGPDTLSVTRRAISALVEAAKTVAVGAEHDLRFLLLFRALELAIQKKLDAEVRHVSQHAREEVESLLDTNAAQAAQVVYGVAELDKQRKLLNYPTIADRFERQATAVAALPKEERRSIRFGSPFGVAYGIARTTRQTDRVQRLGRLHVTALLDFAEERRADGETAFNVRQWVLVANDELAELADCSDLRERVRRLLPEVAKQMEGELTEHEFKRPFTEAEVAEVERARKLIVEAGEDWPETAALVLLRYTSTRADADRLGKSIYDELVGRQSIGNGHVTQTQGDDWRHRYADTVRILIESLFWPNILLPALHDLYQRDLTQVRVLIRPFVAKGLPTSETIFAMSAGSTLALSDYVAATQLWTLMIERLIRFAVHAIGGSTTVVRRDGSDREAVFDSAVNEFEKLCGRENAVEAQRLCDLLRCVFSWPGYGWNLRNNVAHGLVRPEGANAGTAYMAYLLAVLIVAPISVREPSSEAEPELS